MDREKLREIFKIAIPAMGEMTLYTMIWILDTMMIGKYAGQIGLSSVGLSTEIIYSFYHILVVAGISTALTSLIAINLGAKNYENAKLFALVGIQLAILVGLFFFITILFFPAPILKFFGATDIILPHAVKYCKICALTFFFSTLSTSINGIFRGSKDTVTSLYVAGLNNVVNLFLDYVLIFGKFGFPELGIAGAAIATTMASIISFAFQMTRLKRLPFKIEIKKIIDLSAIKEVLKLATPSSLQEASVSLVRLIGITIIMTLGFTSFAANQIVNSIEATAFMPALGIAIANTSLVGHSIGEKNYKKAKEYTRYSTLLSCGFMLILAAFCLIFSKELVSLFIDSKEYKVIELGARCIKIASIEQFPISLAVILNSYFKGSGDMKTPFYISLCTNFLFRLPLCFYFIVVLHKSLDVYWIITAVQWTIEASIIFFMYRRNILKNE